MPYAALLHIALQLLAGKGECFLEEPQLRLNQHVLLRGNISHALNICIKLSILSFGNEDMVLSNCSEPRFQHAIRLDQEKGLKLIASAEINSSGSLWYEAVLPSHYNPIDIVIDMEHATFHPFHSDKMHHLLHLSPAVTGENDRLFILFASLALAEAIGFIILATLYFLKSRPRPIQLWPPSIVSTPLSPRSQLLKVSSLSRDLFEDFEGVATTTAQGHADHGWSRGTQGRLHRKAHLRKGDKTTETSEE